jgi:hypothetical protein
MADRSAKVQDRIREELAKNPGATTGELQAAARSIDASVAGLSLRQFNAGYVLPLKRKNAAGSKKPKAAAPVRRKGGRQKQAAAAPKPAGRARRTSPAPAPAPVGDRERARAALLQFAKDFSAAESRPAIVGVLSNLDRYVDQIIGGRD